MISHLPYIIIAIFCISTIGTSVPDISLENYSEILHHTNLESISTFTRGEKFSESQFPVSLPVYNLRRSPKISKANNVDVENILETIYILLKLCITNEGFNYGEFSSIKNIFQETISFIKDWVKENEPSRSFLLQFRFTKHLFMVMKKATEYLDFLPYHHSIVEYLVSNLIHLNVKIFSLYDCYGNPDTLIEDFTGIVYRHMRDVDYHEKKFQEFENIPLKYQMLFSYQLAKAKHKLQVLARYITTPVTLSDIQSDSILK